MNHVLEFIADARNITKFVLGTGAFLLFFGLMRIFVSHFFFEHNVWLGVIYIALGMMYLGAGLSPDSIDDSWCAVLLGKLILAGVLIEILFTWFTIDMVLQLAIGVVSLIMGIRSRKEPRPGANFMEASNWPYGKS